MELDFLLHYINPVILAICLLVGYVLKTAFVKFPNRFIPLTSLCMGTVIAVLINYKNGINVTVILGGMMSGLASTGMHEMLKNLLRFEGKDDG